MSFDGKQLAHEILLTYKNRDWSQVKLVILQTNNDVSSDAFIRQKMNACNTLGAQSELIKYHESVTEKELLEKIQQLNTDPEVTGIILQLPVYPHLKQNKLLKAIDPYKDVDYLTGNCPLPIRSCVVEAMLILKEHFHHDFTNKQIVVVGLGVTGGGPIFHYLKETGHQVVGCDKHTPNTMELIKTADVVITAIGKPHFFKTTNFKPGVILYDVGVSRNALNKLCGDIDPNGIEKVAKWWSPTPGGVGPFTVLAIMKNLWVLYEAHQRRI
ncbi:bifunctional 5,10-methylenetetrahydrofolate dehydrogenase/5,10-methenyltetrahydrofolate cyclohydrolase [Mycoplasmoides pneumoniae]|uniref:bifunctional 5,10-methylenetetrahydrofolate dehydrogenase/5,10-methenyltetrahydrofolate cyclohydrolase n=1 Tax=Mycoplasmoides pneumoniae TaxID=2104 RepID=UPI0006A6DDEA|nr:bifunctional 5,10-methylenetetrahydrofolate dehydrogenase/5,10-methenyltetrahydrofolate cyclohydrolase [Mycoplasmoides pneumoniae]ALA31302.1 methenyltetrahydrofolate cyclohydrolase [Mycoplasmoides pneumoniae 39443]ALA37652.1 methenyltetrahydrofolate cyclohydrolase [Mycoplasmoides pneumoniae M2592]ARQ38429.1 bifunctional 5,10-methylene-tetrahydrofolate dehydrogenase/5,10-methylene-tetrahydrofolate cyclohydrolase [Mycoplasmoides pneumoniae]ARQ39133.1 bifunctional 5,10-methylene-tetrahydrofolat